MLLVATAGCTGEDEPPSSLPSRSVEPQPVLEAKPVATDIAVGKVLGAKLGRQQRKRLEGQVSRVVSRYFDAAFLGGEYPRRDFSAAFGTFSRGAADRARGDRSLLTNAAVGATTDAVAAKAKKVRLDVLVPQRRVVGLTARVRLVFVRKSSDGADQRVTVKGRLLLDRKKSGPWQVFGYDLTRSSVPVGKGAHR
jgi:hypothetical protein